MATHYNENGGVNPNGVEVVSVLLSTETSGSYDASARSVAGANGYTFAGLDSTAARTNRRAGLAYYRGSPITSWPISDRRRLAVVNMVSGSPSHQEFEILHNMQFSNPADVRAAIDAVQAAPAGTSFATWKAGFVLPEGQDGPGDDPDGDGFPTALEFYAATDPLDGSSMPMSLLLRTPTGFTYTYRRATDRLGVAHTLQTGTLDSFAPFTPMAETVLAVAPNIQEVTIMLEPGFGPFLRQEVRLVP